MGFRAGVAYREAILVSKKLERGRAKFLVILFIVIAVPVIGYAIHWSREPHTGRVKDEALLAGRDASSFHAADEDYFHDMDGGIDLTAGAPENDKSALVKGRNTWLVWTAGNDRLWNTPTGTDPARWGLWLDKPRADCKPDPFKNEQKYPGAKVGSRGTKTNGKDFPVGSFYGYEPGIVGLEQRTFRKSRAPA